MKGLRFGVQRLQFRVLSLGIRDLGKLGLGGFILKRSLERNPQGPFKGILKVPTRDSCSHQETRRKVSEAVAEALAHPPGANI